ncbi:DnaJ C-terminal domain-containing protein [soil metagenome]
MKFKDYYQIMGLERTATADQIKQAYRKLAHKYHPDISKDSQAKEKFQEIGEAYAVLKDAEKRLAYDDLGKRPANENFTPPPDWQQHFNTGQSGFDDVDLSDLFAQMGRQQHGTRRHANSPAQGQDYEISAAVTLEQLFRGGEIEIRAELPEVDQHGLAHRVARTFRITLPPGAADGQRLRLTGKGGPGLHGGRQGDLYVELALQSHPLYKVSGRDLYIDLPLAPWEAVLGAAVHVPTLAGTVELNIKPDTNTGQKLRLAKRGLPAADGSFGALYAVVSIEIPKTSSVEERALYVQLATISTFNPRQHFTSGAAI